jgi:hypothetical protein
MNIHKQIQHISKKILHYITCHEYPQKNLHVYTYKMEIHIKLIIQFAYKYIYLETNR